MTIDLQPSLEGELVVLRPLVPEDWDALFAAASDPLIWQQHPAKDRWTEPVFRRYFREALDEAATGRGGAFVVLDRKSGRIIGSTRFHGYDANRSEIEIGWTFLARHYWGGRYNREMKQLMLAHAFAFVEQVIFLVGLENIRSQKAMERIGGVNCGLVQRPGSAGALLASVRYVIRRDQWPHLPSAGDLAGA